MVMVHCMHIGRASFSRKEKFYLLMFCNLVLNYG